VKSAFRPLLAVLGAVVLLASPMRASSRHGDADTLLAQQVYARLLAAAENADSPVWPPMLLIEKTSTVNAYARPEYTDDGIHYPAAVIITTGMLDSVVEGDADRAAFVLGHELAHHALGHPPRLLKRRATTFSSLIYSRQDEFDADLRGAALALAAGYSNKRGLRVLQRCIELGLEYSSFEGAGTDHPSWKERLAAIDREQATLWNSMAAFDNGNYFLVVEQYMAAERCFRFVTAEFPSCAEAWANLGYVLLMQYCDQLTEDDVRSYAIGHIVTGGFYKRAYSLEYQMRGEGDNELWWQAVGALREALRLNPSSTLTKANLGIAYLVRPEGKDLAQASRFLLEAAEEAMRDETLDTEARMAVLVNTGVLEMSEQGSGKSRERFDAADRLGKSLVGRARSNYASSPIALAVDYNRACLLGESAGASDRRSAMGLLDRYLRGMAPTSAWWPLAYERYRALCESAGKDPAARESYVDRWKRKGFYKPVVGVEEGGASLVQLAQTQEEIGDRLGAVTVIPVAGRAPIQRMVSDARSMELLLTSGRVLMITLRAPSTPVALQRQGPGAERSQLAVGMTRAQAERILGDVESDGRPAVLFEKRRHYELYRSLGLGLRFEDNVLTEIVIANLQLD
jgi:Zn-dependent protease with chaperone function